ncbi:response regulator transcription factor [Hymenobacter ruricola]|uniref:Response regulator transcription factor n=1 Tax=Hymenobacter ruricola TaxID=2791023 RepID=A0ABS0I9X4_9BACT|nr:response regulator transcription factor [Hymenobacter ruricola]MBF9223766.1 response regulator transcription factor [Hymenobacter ruricola]
MSTLPLVHISILDDHRLFRQGITYILQNLPFATAVQEAATFSELQAQFAQQVPDVLLLDLQMPDISGIDATKQLLKEHPDLKIIVISMHSTDDFIAHMLKLGVRSYLPKDVDKQLLSTAIAAVVADGYYFTDGISRAMMRGLASGTPPKPSFQATAAAFTPRETEVLTLLCKGYSTNKIAEALFISDRTVEGHRKSLLEKTNTPNAVSLALYAVKHGLLAIDSNSTPPLP